MGVQDHPLLIVSCKVLLTAEQSPNGPAIFRQLARRTREGAHLLLTAAEPDQWFPTRGTQDSVLGTQGRLQERLQEVGGDLDGIYYVPRSMFTQDRKRAAALEDILKRYGSEPANAALYSTSRAFLKAAERLGIRTITLDEGEPGMTALLESLAG